MKRSTTPTPKSKAAAKAVSSPRASLSTVSKDWRPEEPVEYAPLFQPTQWGPLSLGKYFLGWPGYLWPWNCIYFAVTVASYVYTTPNSKACLQMPVGCTEVLYFRNLALLWLFAGGWHYYFYMRKANGSKQKYDANWQATDSPKFLFGDQVYSNVFWSCVSGVTIWSLYEVMFMWLWQQEKAPVYYDWWSKPYYSFGLLLAIPIWREFHFYWVHRMSHWGPFYRMFHYLHHTNTNPGPWSGLAMHPIEHILYFSVVLIHLFIDSHPIHFFFNAQHTGLTPAGSHSGFHGPVAEDSVPGGVPVGSYFHYLHHRYFECNYGEATIPLDRWFGTFRDGKREVGKLTAEAGGRGKSSSLVSGLVVLFGSSMSFAPLAYGLMKLHS